MENLLTKAIQSVQRSETAFCKFLSANDTKITKAHQSGYLISISAWSLFLDKAPEKGANLKKEIRIKWQDDFETTSVFTYYGASKNEFRITRLGRNFPFREDDNVGDLFVLARKSEGCYEAFILSTDEDIEDFFAELNISPASSNGIIPKQFEQLADDVLLQCFDIYIKSVAEDFPATFDLAKNARNCYLRAYSIRPSTIKMRPDTQILKWLDAEFQLFKAFENSRYAERIQTAFSSVEELILTANTILNRRKSRAGKSLEHHLAEIFHTFDLNFTTQAKTEGNKKPDFLFPNIESYQNPSFSNDRLMVLASKTTCKDRWRQILNEADRVKTKHLFTLQQGISKNQLEEMYKYGVCLVVPAPYLKSFPDDFHEHILTLEGFIGKVKSLQS